MRVQVPPRMEAKATGIRRREGDTFDLIVTLSPEAHHHGVELTRVMPADVEYWPTPDATVMLESGDREQILTAYREVRDSLFQRVKERFLPPGGGPSI